MLFNSFMSTMLWTEVKFSTPVDTRVVLDASGVANLAAIVLRLLLISKTAVEMVNCCQQIVDTCKAKMLNSNTSLNMLSKTVMLSYTSTIMLADHVEEVYDKNDHVEILHIVV